MKLFAIFLIFAVFASGSAFVIPDRSDAENQEQMGSYRKG